MMTTLRSFSSMTWLPHSDSSMIAAGSSCECALAFHSLPDQQYGHSDRDVARPF